MKQMKQINQCRLYRGKMPMSLFGILKRRPDADDECTFFVVTQAKVLSCK
jgi:hypothetical protein